jgi:hypothetical protein
MNEKQIEEFNLEMSREIDAERREEHVRESQETIFDSWKSDNIRELRMEFCEAHEEEFNDFLNEAFKEWKAL